MEDEKGIERSLKPFFGPEGMWAHEPDSDGSTPGIWMYNAFEDGTSQYSSNPQVPSTCDAEGSGPCTTASADQLKSAWFSKGGIPSFALNTAQSLINEDYKFVPGQVQVPNLEAPEPTCGGTCDTWRECAATFAGGCKCVVDLTVNMAKVASLGAVFASTCSPALSRVQTHHRPAGRLNGRDEGAQWACPCNSSYVSEECCESESGFVWEDPALKLGVLK